MGDFSIMKEINNKEIETDDIISLDQIIGQIPFLTYEMPMTFILYKEYNKKLLTPEQKEIIDETIDKLKTKQQGINKKNLKYMDKHLISS